MKQIFKITSVLAFVMVFSLSSYGQEKEKMSKELPSFEMLPKKAGKFKVIYELPNKVDYKVYNLKGKLKVKGNTQFIDITKYKKGTYFVLYDCNTIKMERT